MASESIKFGTCPYCPVLTFYRDLNAHIDRMHPKAVKPGTKVVPGGVCEHCDPPMYVHMYEDHVNKVHPGER